MASAFGALSVASLQELAGKHPARLLHFSPALSVGEATRLLWLRGFRSAPVAQEEGAAGGLHVLGFVDARDFLVLLLAELARSTQSPPSPWAALLRRADTRDAASRVLSFPVSRAVNRSRTDRLETVAPGTRVAEAAQLMRGLRLHRLAVVSPEGQLHSVLTASDLIAHLAEHATFWRGKQGKTTAEELTADQRETPVALSEDRPAIEGFELMHHNQVSGIAIVDGRGALTATLSASDLSFALSEDLELIGESIFLPVHLFLQQHSVTGATRRPVTVAPDATAEEAVRKLAAYRVHRVWVVDEEQRPLKVVTPFEIFALFQPEE